MKLNKSDLRVWVIDEDMTAVLRIATSFTPKTWKIVSKCKQRHLTLSLQAAKSSSNIC
jgi:hypothetical protein